jgi:hypothetical protein
VTTAIFKYFDEIHFGVIRMVAIQVPKEVDCSSDSDLAFEGGLILFYLINL